ncbi:MAG: class III extradiol ring-cleavage dioxygenase [Betaproteobacteria bacterium]|nr:class III extradiol ring-cleavage dioxygenase [Betaproteobacteria bacterium]
MPDSPTLFISHGSPLIAVEDRPSSRFLAQWGGTLGRPSAILVVSAHWQTHGQAAVSLAPRPETIHDFHGFPDPLYDLAYPAPGAVDCAMEAARLLEAAGFGVTRNPSRGLDHGAWVPLALMYPGADLPVAQLSLIRDAQAADHYRLGAALQPLRKAGVLIVGSGALTHNLHELSGAPVDPPAPAWAVAFAEWVAHRVDERDVAALLDYRRAAPHAARAHPTEEHLMPLFVALGAAGRDFVGERAFQGYEHGALAMDDYLFHDA